MYYVVILQENNTEGKIQCCLGKQMLDENFFFLHFIWFVLFSPLSPALFWHLLRTCTSGCTGMSHFRVLNQHQMSCCLFSLAWGSFLPSTGTKTTWQRAEDVPDAGEGAHSSHGEVSVTRLGCLQQSCTLSPWPGGISERLSGDFWIRGYAGE